MSLTTAVLDHPVTDRLFRVASVLLGAILAVLTLGAVIGWSTIPASSVVAVLLLDALYIYVVLLSLTMRFYPVRR